MGERSPILAGNRMADLYFFSPTAFNSPDPAEQSVIDLILALALVYNDIRDVLAIIAHLKEVQPPPSARASEGGEYWGMVEHQYRKLISTLYEIFYLIRQRQRDISHRLFAEIEGRMGRGNRAHWNDLKAAASGDTHSRLGAFQQLARTIRDDVGHHYVDTKELAKGFRWFFESHEGRRQEGCYVSFSPGMEGARYYFADAAAQGYIRTLLGNTNGPAAKIYGENLTRCAKSAREAISGLIEGLLSVRNAPREKSRFA